MLLVLMMVACTLVIPHAHAAPKGPGDVDGNGVVDIQDIVLATTSYRSVTGGPNWNPNADLNGDGRVDIFDLTTIIRYYGSHYA